MLANTELGSLADSLKEGLTAFEKKCDELSAQQMTEAKYTAFGPDPLAAYYNAVETETKMSELYSRRSSTAFPQRQ